LPSSSIGSSGAPGAAAPRCIVPARSLKASLSKGISACTHPAGIAAANEWTRKAFGKDFDRLSAVQRAEALKAMDEGKAEFANFSSRAYFSQLLAITMAGFFSDPIYGGNRDKVSWKMLGFPGLPAIYADKIDAYRNKRYVAEPQSIADFS
jgi:gluconate 2-dehydrogenase gamma chain